MIENLVVSLETAKKLKEAGWNKPTEYVWASDGRCVFPFPYNLDGTMCFPAPTAEELLSELPEKITFTCHDGSKDMAFIFIDKEKNVWCIEYPDFFHGKELKNKSLSEAAASMWLWLKENNYLGEK